MTDQTSERPVFAKGDLVRNNIELDLGANGSSLATGNLFFVTDAWERGEASVQDITVSDLGEGFGNSFGAECFDLVERPAFSVGDTVREATGVEHHKVAGIVLDVGVLCFHTGDRILRRMTDYTKVEEPEVTKEVDSTSTVAQDLTEHPKFKIEDRVRTVKTLRPTPDLEFPAGTVFVVTDIWCTGWGEEKQWFVSLEGSAMPDCHAAFFEPIPEADMSQSVDYLRQLADRIGSINVVNDFNPGDIARLRTIASALEVLDAS